MRANTGDIVVFLSRCYYSLKTLSLQHTYLLARRKQLIEKMTLPILHKAIRPPGRQQFNGGYRLPKAKFTKVKVHSVAYEFCLKSTGVSHTHSHPISPPRVLLGVARAAQG